MFITVIILQNKGFFFCFFCVGIFWYVRCSVFIHFHHLFYPLTEISRQWNVARPRIWRSVCLTQCFDGIAAQCNNHWLVKLSSCEITVPCFTSFSWMCLSFHCQALDRGDRLGIWAGTEPEKGNVRVSGRLLQEEKVTAKNMDRATSDGAI